MRTADEVPLTTLCCCGCQYGQHKAVLVGKPMPCKGKNDTCECRDFLRSPKEPSAVEAALTVFENAIRERICQPSAKAEERCVVARDRYLAELRLDDLRSSAFRDSVIDRIEAGIPLVTKQPAQLPPERLLIVGLMTAGALAILTALLAMALVLFQ